MSIPSSQIPEPIKILVEAQPYVVELEYDVSSSFYIYRVHLESDNTKNIF